MKKKSLILTAALFAGLAAAQAQFNVIHNFATNSYPDEGAMVVAPGTNVMYGMTPDGGKNGDGDVFSINTDGSNYKELWSFADTGNFNHNSNGEYPYGGLTLVNNKLYGMLYEGGSHSYGMIFCINMDGTSYKDLYDFSDTGSFVHNSDAAYPDGGSLIYTDGKLFGMTYRGGSSNEGVVFSIDTLGHHYKDIMDFNNTNGAYPYGSLCSSGKVLFGVTYYGGAHNDGTIFRVDTNGTHYMDIFDYANNNDGYDPYGSVVLSGNKLFCMSYDGGGYNDGALITIDTAGHNYKPLINFNGVNAAYPDGSDVLVFGKKLYGMTYEGGAGNYGVVFSIDSDGNNMATLHQFNLADGEYPYGNLTMLGGDTLFGMTDEGGNFNGGTLFRLVDTNFDLSVNNIQASAGGINVYPNPSNGKYTVEIANYDPSIEHDDIQVYNVLGETVYPSYQMGGPSFIVDMSLQPGGVYFLKVISNKGYLIGESKLVIQK